MNQQLIAQAIDRFNAGEFRLALLAFEQAWHTERSDALRALILLCNALHQLQLGLVTAPRRNLSSAARLLDGSGAGYAGIELPMVREYIVSVQSCIPDGLETDAGSVEWAAIPSIRL